MNNKYKFFLSFVLIVSCLSLTAQSIGELPLQYNAQLEGKTPNIQTRNTIIKKLPFIDDFSNNSALPNPLLWQDNQVFINSNYPALPPSKGVATFDGLNSNGLPYNHGFGGSDTLTSHSIELTSYSRVYLSFYIQPKGIGFIPRTGDSLVVEGKNLLGQWKHLESFKGLADAEAFKPAPEFQRYQKELGDEFLHNDFQLRFRNYSSNRGIENLWHLDYVMLTEDQVTPFINDVAFTQLPSSLLKTYTAYPLEHVKNNIELVNNKINITIKNNSRVSQEIDSSFFEVYDLTNQRDVYIDETLLDVPPLVPVNQRIVAPGINTYNNVYGTFAVSDYIADYPDSSLYMESVYRFVLRTEDNDPAFLSNNNISVKTTLDNYIAYDDGSAESALATYNGNGITSKIAVKYTLTQADSLQSVRILFPFYDKSFTSKLFNLLIYTGSLKEEPDYIIKNISPKTGNQFQPFSEYLIKDFIEEGILLPEGDFYIGWEHPSGTKSNFIPFGFDKNHPDANQFIYFDIGGGWENLQEKQPYNDGALLIRPTVGQQKLLTSNEPSLALNRDIKLYPNPITHTLHVESLTNDIQPDQYRIRNVAGQTIATQPLNQNYIHMHELTSGIYFLSLYQNNKYLGTFKVIKK